MKVLVVGGAGYVGGAFIDLIQKTNHARSAPYVEVHVYDNLLYERQYLKNVIFHHGDVRDQHKLLMLIEGEDYDAIVWLAAIVGDPACNLNPELAREINEESVRWLSEIAGERRIIFMSTCSVYGSNMKKGLTEDDDTNPLSIYAETKLAAERHLVGKNAAIFRLGTLYGMGDQFARPRFDLVVNVMTANMVKNGSLTVNGGDQMRPLLHVKDIARIILAACMSERRDTYNLARYNIRIDELARLIKDTLGYGEIKMAERENLTEGMDARDYSVCTSKFDRDFQMDYFYSIERAVAEIAHVISTRRIKNHKNPIFNNMLNIRERLSE